MVQLKVIRGGKFEEECSDSPVKLFSAHSIADNFFGRAGVRFNWIYLEREKPVAPYEKLICGYKSMDKKVRPYFEEHINELFTEQELEALKAFLNEAHPALAQTLEVAEEGLPASDAFIPMPYGSISPGGGRDFYYPFLDKPYALPFKAGAYYDLRSCPPSGILSDEARIRGQRYIREAMKALGVQSEIDPSQLERIVDALYTAQGLYVGANKPTASQCTNE